MMISDNNASSRGPQLDWTGQQVKVYIRRKGFYFLSITVSIIYFVCITAHRFSQVVEVRLPFCVIFCTAGELSPLAVAHQKRLLFYKQQYLPSSFRVLFVSLVTNGACCWW